MLWFVSELKLNQVGNVLRCRFPAGLERFYFVFQNAEFVTFLDQLSDDADRDFGGRVVTDR